MIFFFLSLFFPAMASGQVYHTQKELVTSYIDSTVNEDLEGAVLGLLAIGPEGDTIAAFNPSTLLIPASNMKLVTTGLALDALGSSHVYETGIAYSGEISGGTLHGDLYITGGGDPTLASDDSIAATLPELFGRWTEMLEDAGIRKISGHIIGDDRYFDTDMPEEQTWQWDDCGTYYGTGISGLTFFENIQSFDVRPGNHTGDKVAIRESFPVCPWMEYRYNCTTGEAGTGDRLYYYTSDLRPCGEMRGTFASDRAAKTLECSNKFPAYTCASYFADWIGKAGIECVGGPADTGYFLPENGTAGRDSLTVLGKTGSADLLRIAFETNHESNNLYAETLYHTIGKEICGSGDYAPSAQAVRKLLEDMGLDPGKVCIRDGSGLSRHNLLSPSFICSFLLAMTESPEFGSFIYSLPSPGSDGTLKGVMAGYDRELTSRIRLKSGSMTGVKCFSGYIFPTRHDADNPESGGKPAVFSIMINNSLLSQYRMQGIIDRLLYLLSGR